MTATSMTAAMLETAPQAEIVARARALAPLIRDEAAAIEAGGKLTERVLDALHGAGIFRIGIPAVYGGLDLDPMTCGRVVEELAIVDGSVGWCAMLPWQIGAMAGSIPPTAAAAMFSEPRAVGAGTARAAGTATPVGGGYRINGRWPFASGSTHATWFGAECQLVDGEGQPVKDDSGDEVHRMFFLPRAQVTVINTWSTIGLRGTGSNDFAVDDVVVPAEFSYRPVYDPPYLGHPRYTNICLDFIGQATVMLGMARGALEAAVDIARASRVYGGQGMAERQRFQSAIAEAQALVESGESYVYGSASALWDHICAGNQSTPEQRARVRLASTHGARSAVSAVDLLYREMGTSVLFTASPIERRFRDLHAAAAHVMIGQLSLEAAGRVALGMEAQFPYF